MYILNLKVFWLSFFLLNFHNISCENSNKKDEARWLSNVEIMKSYMDFTADPCTDFYQYACGKWSKINDKIDHGDVLGLIEVKINKQIQNLLELLDLKSAGKNSALIKAKNFYRSCIDGTDQNIRSFLDSFELFKNLKPVNSNETNKNAEWIKSVATLRLYGVNVLIEESVLPHWNNSSQNVIYLDKAKFSSLDQNYYLDPSLQHFLMIYKISIAELFGSLGINGNDSYVIASDIVDFEKELAIIMSNQDENADEAEEMVLGYLIQLIPQIDWVKYLSIIMQREVDLYETVIVINIGYLQRLADIVESTSTKNLVNYFKFRVLATLDDVASFNEEGCTNLLRYKLGYALSVAYVEKYYDQKDIDEVICMIEELKTSFNDIIDQTNWLDDQTKESGKLKLSSILSSVSLNIEQKSRRQIDNYYRDLEIDRYDFHENYWRIMKYAVRKEHERLSARNIRSEHDKSQTVANAYYLKTQNLIVIPAGLLQAPVYDRDYLKSYNYGVLGAIIGHEISHGFDYSGKDYDDEGNIRTWWDDKTIQMYNERIQCMIEKYNNYSVAGFDEVRSGENTISENIADNLGLRLAYRAYERLEQPKQIIGGINITNKQLFFLSFAQFYCSEFHSSVLKKIFSEHSIDKYRVIGSLSNLDEFSSEYNCQLGLSMNPVEKCRVW